MKNKPFARWFRELRIKAGLSQADMGRIVKLGRPTISRLEHGHFTCSPKACDRIAKRFARGTGIDERYLRLNLHWLAAVQLGYDVDRVGP